MPHDGLSSVIGPTSPPLDERTLGQFWDDLVARYPDSPALVSSHEFSTVHSLDHPPYGLESLGPAGSVSKDDCLRWDFKEMGKYVDAVARGLLKMGLKRGDRIGVYLGNGSAYAMLQWASAKVSYISFPFEISILKFDSGVPDRYHISLHQSSLSRTRTSRRPQPDILFSSLHPSLSPEGISYSSSQRSPSCFGRF